MGDRRGRTTTKSTETNTNSSTNAATQVLTVADFKPLESEKTTEVKSEKQPEVKKEASVPAAKKDYVAHFVRDVVVDGTTFPANTVFEQTWYLRNAGDVAWPAGCSVKFVGGDNMCSVDPEHPASVHELVSAAESTIVESEVAPGQEVGFTVKMRSPGRAGNFISYWRLTGPDGDKFGHRLWCDVNVKETPAPVQEQAIKAAEPESQRSQMIFPKLEKESPTTSIHEERSATAPSVSAQDEVEEFDDFSADFEDEETEDGFMTDEEYDILDASDEEFLAEQGKAARK
jgi:next-to-BRCA1 protein 1